VTHQEFHRRHPRLTAEPARGSGSLAAGPIVLKAKAGRPVAPLRQTRDVTM
jgi:hypothetical protein